MNKPKPVFLLAGGRAAVRVSPDPLFQTVFREYGVAYPVVAYVGAAHGDDRRFFGFISNLLLETGAGKVNHAVMCTERADLKKAEETLGSADLVFVSGGDVDEGMRVIEKRNMVGYLRQLYEDGKPFIGVSAGAIMLAKKWVRWKDPDDDSTPQLFPCLNIAPVVCDTHAEQDDWEELKMALKLSDDGEKGYGIVSGTAIKIHPDGEVQAIGGAAHQFIRKKGEVVRLPDIQPLI